MKTPIETPLAKLYDWERSRPDVGFLYQPFGQEWKSYSWRQAATQARQMAAALKDLGVQQGDRVALFSKNCAHWIMADLAIMLCGAVSVPLYANQSAETLTYVLKHSGTRFLFVGKLDEAPPAGAIPDDIKTISFPYECLVDCDYEWDLLLKRYAPFSESPDWPLDQLATIVYTSGTTGMPKGVMHTFRSLSFAPDHFVKHLEIDESDRFMSYLPLSHIAERALIELGALYAGGGVYFVESMDTFADNLRSASPTVFFSVPRLWQKFHDAILEKLPQKKLDLLLKIPVVSSLIKKKVQQNLGLHQARSIGSGAAAISPNLIEWYARLGIEILEGYGMTENMAYTSIMTRGDFHSGSVGKVLPDCEVKIDESGEILVKSDAVMAGYYLNDEATANTFKQGYLRTGDVGTLDADGYLSITGRVKDIFKTDKGKYVAPAPIENRILDEPLVDQLCLIGTGLPQPIALIVPSEQGMAMAREDLEEALQKIRSSINQQLESHEKIASFVIVKDAWTIESGFLTPTMKLKRHLVEKHYAPVIADKQLHKQAVVWEA